MVLTRPQGRAAFTHVLDNVLERDDDSGLKKALLAAGVSDVCSLYTLDEATIDSLTYDDTANNLSDIAVVRGDKNLVRIFKDFVTVRNSSSTPIADDGWEDLTPAEFDAFRIDPTYQGQRSLLSVRTTSPTPQSSTSSNTPKQQTSPAENFKRGIKKDQSLFPTLKDERFNDAWHRTFENQARAQDVKEILDDTYIPTTPEEIELFEEKQVYMYAVLETKVLTDRGKAIVREFEKSHDAQQTYAKLKDHHLTSTKAKMASSDLLSHITSVRLGTNAWKGTTEAFVAAWEEKVRLFERQASPADHFTDSLKRTMLENAVSPIKELRAVKTTADLEQTKTGQSITYAQYVSLLYAAAATYDLNANKLASKRYVLQHESLVHDDDDAEDGGGEYYSLYKTQFGSVIKNSVTFTEFRFFQRKFCLLHQKYSPTGQ